MNFQFFYVIGNATLLKLSENLVEFSKDERSTISNLFERETRRERILSTIMKEEECVQKNVQIIENEKDDVFENRIRMAEEHYYETIKNERDLRVAQMQKMIEREEKDI